MVIVSWSRKIVQWTLMACSNLYHSLLTYASFDAMKFLTILLLPLCSSSLWCETNANIGCRGQSRHFVREASATNPFLAFGDIKTSKTDDAIVADWDGDGDWDVILRADKNILLFEFKPGQHFVQVEPNPFEKIPSWKCRPAVVDWNQDGKQDLIVGTKEAAREVF